MARLVALPDKFRGTASAGEVAVAMAAGARRHGWEVVVQPLSDGGEGLLEVYAVRRLRLRMSRVCGPRRDEVAAEWRTDGSLAVVEMARASGLALVGGPAGNDAVRSTSLGTGQLIAEAAADVGDGGRVVVGLGGSATTDGGFDAAMAVRAAGGLRGADLVGACDVRIGFVEAARLFAPQKGASPEEVDVLESRLRGLAARYLEEFGVDVTAVPGAGAAGGFGGAVLALGGRLRSGYELVAETVGLPGLLAGADLVMTGEGALDAQSFLGKVVGGVVDDATRVGVPVVVVAGRASEEGLAEAARRGVRVVTLLDRFGLSQALEDPVACVATVTGEVLSDSHPVAG